MKFPKRHAANVQATKFLQSHSGYVFILPIVTACGNLTRLDRPSSFNSSVLSSCLFEEKKKVVFCVVFPENNHPKDPV